MSISINGLDFFYGSNQVLKDINLEINDGELVALMGLSGCGKTTLLRVLLGLNPIQSGKVEINGITLNGSDNISKLRSIISYIPQHGALYPHLKVLDNIFLPIKVQRKVTKEDHERAKELASICNIDTNLFSRYPSELSGGQKQRVSILRALLMNTPYIFLDEPLSALDPITKISIQNEFKEVFKREGKTIIMVTHSLNEAKYLCDKLVILNKGSVEQVDATTNVIASPNEGFVKEFITSQM